MYWLELTPVLAVGALALGAILCSFLNVLVFRFNTGRGLGGRSRCMHCSHTLGAIDLVPVFSFIFLKGRCRYCSARSSLQYPIVEISAAILSLATYLVHPAPAAFAFWLVVWMAVLFIVVYDLRHSVIPWSASGLLLALAAISLFVSFEPAFAALYPSTLALVAGPLLALPLFLFSLISK